MDIRNISWPGWETVRLIGRGSFSEVYEIRRDVLGEEERAALKVISIPQNDSDIEDLHNDGYDDASITSTFQSHLKSIVAEYSLMRKLNGNSNIVSCEDVRYVQHDDGIGWDIFIKMELLTPLPKTLLAKEDEAAVIQIGKDICAALELCGKHSIIHRDIKPQNIFMSEHGDYKLGDFGIAKTVEKTSGGTKIGTYKYMAPEVYNNQPYGAAADQYSLGLVLYWLLNERRMPFMPLPPAGLTAGMEEESRTRRFRGEPLPPPIHGSEELKKIVLKACAYDPKARYASAGAMLAALNGLTGGPVAAAVSVQTQTEAPAGGQRQKTASVEAVITPDNKAAAASKNGAGQDISRGSTAVEKTPDSAVDKEPKTKTGGKKKRSLPWLIAAVAVVIIIVILLLSKCAGGCQHQWQEATCLQPKTCQLCGKTRGDPAQHSWSGTGEDALCTVCGQTRQAVEQGAQNTGMGTVKVTLDPAGGEVSQAALEVTYQSAYGQLPTPTLAGYSFQGWYTEETGGSQVNAASLATTPGEQTLYARWSANSYTVRYDANGGQLEQKEATVVYDSAYGQLPTPTKEGFTFLGWFTEKNGGEPVSADTKMRNPGEQTLYARWSGNAFTLSFHGNGGSVSQEDRAVECGSAYGTLPVPQRDYYHFQGWYTAKSGGEKVSDATLMGTEDTVLYAHWEQNPLSDWVLANNVPSGARIQENKWTYTRTQNKESTSSSMSGWTQVGSYWNKTGSGSTKYATFPSGFDKTHSVYTGMAKAPYTASETDSTKREVTNQKTGYVYWHWMYDTGGASGTSTRAIYNKKGTGPTNNFYYKYFYAFTSTKGNYSSDTSYCNSLGIRNYIVTDQKTSNAQCGGATRWFRFDYYTSTYTDYEKIYQYQLISKGLESASKVTAGGEISDVQHYVRYREK